MMTSISRVTTTSTNEPAIAASRPSATPTTKANAHHRDADEQRDARAEDQARQHVAAVAVGSQQEAQVPPAPDGPAPHELAELLGRRMRRDDFGEQRRQHDQRQHERGRTPRRDSRETLRQKAANGVGLREDDRAFLGAKPARCQRPWRIRGLIEP